MITEFTFEILSFDTDKGFNVLYTPASADCTSISQWVKLPPLTNRDEIMKQLSNASPQGEWQRQIDALTEDLELYQSLIGTQHEAIITSISSTNTFSLSTVEEIKSRII